MPGTEFTQEQSGLQQARREVLDWLRAPGRFPMFLLFYGEDELSQRHGRVAQKFLSCWAQKAGFACEIVNVASRMAPAYEARWTHRGASFVGFKQPPPAPNREDAKLLACAALLRNDWCLRKLEEAGGLK